MPKVYGFSASTFIGSKSQTMPASQAANTTLWTYTINDTQANSVIATQYNLGTSGKSQGILLKGTGSFPGNTTELDKFLTLWGNTAGNANKVFSVGSGTTYVESWYLLARGDWVGTNAAAISINSSSATAYTAGHSGANAVTGYKYGSGGNNLNFSTIAFDGSSVCSFVTSAKADYYQSLNLSREVSSAATVTDTYSLASFTRTNISNHASATLNAQGNVLLAQNTRTQTLGTCTDTVTVIKAVQDANSTGDIVATFSAATKHFYVKSNGLPGWIAADKQTTVGAAGGASALPATPTGYLKVDVAGTTFVVPYYAAS